MSTSTRRRDRRVSVAALLMGLAVVEVLGIIAVAHVIGAWPTIALLLGQAMVGGWLVRRTGRRARMALRGTGSGGRLPSGGLADAVLAALAGFLLILPGFVSDIAALLLLTPAARPLGRRVLGGIVGRRLQTATAQAGAFGPVTVFGIRGAGPASPAGTPFGARQAGRSTPEPGTIGPDGVIEGEIL